MTTHIVSGVSDLGNTIFLNTQVLIIPRHTLLHPVNSSAVLKMPCLRFVCGPPFKGGLDSHLTSKLFIDYLSQFIVSCPLPLKQFSTCISYYFVLCFSSWVAHLSSVLNMGSLDPLG